MALLSVRLGGTAALLAAVANGGNKLFSYLGSEEGMKTIKAAGSIIQDIGNNELTVLSIVQSFVRNSAPGSTADQLIGQIDFNALLPDGQKAAKDAVSAMGKAAVSGTEKAVERNVDEVIASARKKVKL